MEMIQTFEMLDKEKLTDEISPTKTGHEDTKRTQLTFGILATKHNTLNGKFTDFDHSLKILLDATAGVNLKSIPFGKKMYFLLLIPTWHDKKQNICR